MADLGLDWKNLRAILLTHSHADHSLGAQFLRDATGAGAAPARRKRPGSTNAPRNPASISA
jgi:glyoxylase-like metal-dependent hydrolase (beta-lactamase superfamily II)